MKTRLFILILVMAAIAPSLSVLAVEEHTTRHTPKHQEHSEERVEKLTQEQHTHEEHAEHEKHGEHEEQGKHAEAGHADKHGGHEEHGEHGGHKEYPKLAKGIHKIAYLAIGFITFVLIAVPIGAHLEKKKHPHPSHH